MLEAQNGLMLHCGIGDAGHHGDGFIFCRSGLIPFLCQHSLFLIVLLYCILGDSTYLNNDLMLSVFKGNPDWLPPRAAAFNTIVCPLCSSVKWGYEKNSQV